MLKSITSQNASLLGQKSPVFSYFVNLHFKSSNRTKSDSCTNKEQIAINDPIIYNSQAWIVFNLHWDSTQIKTACEEEL